MQRNKFVKGVCIFLAILMLGSVLIGVIQALALTPSALTFVSVIPMIDKISLLV